MEQDIQTEALGHWMQKEPLEKMLGVGSYGPPELKHDEKIRYLGQFKERVIRLLTKKQVTEPALYPEIVEALQNPRADKMLINGDLGDVFTAKYQRLARRLQKNYTVTHDPELKGDTGLEVISKDAVEVPDITVRDRQARLQELDISAGLARAAGQKICPRCYDQIIKADPREAVNSQPLTLADRFWGEHCPVCREHGPLI